MTRHLRFRQAVLPYTPRFAYAAQLVWRRTPIWRRAGAIFVHIPKNGGTSINVALYGRFMGHLTAAEIRRWAPRTFAALPSFAVTRNPWDRCLSAWRYVRAGQGAGRGPPVPVDRPERYRLPELATFERFVEEWLPSQELSQLDQVFHPQLPYIADSEGRVLVSFLGRIEDIGEVAAFLARSVGGAPRIGHVNRTGEPGHYREWYTPRMRDIVACVYADDVERLGYDF